MKKLISNSAAFGIIFSAAICAAPQQVLADRHSHGDTLSIPVASQAPNMQDIPRPRSGQKGTSVVRKFGEPLAISAPVGEPPITRWDYTDFYVYFEYDHVIRSVLKHKNASVN